MPMNPPSPWRSPLVRAVLWFELLLLLLLAVGLWAAQRQTRAAELQVLQVLARAVAERVDGTLQAAQAALATSAADAGADAAARSNTPAARQVLRQRALALPMFDTMAVVDSDGRVLVAAGETESTAMPVRITLQADDGATRFVLGPVQVLSTDGQARRVLAAMAPWRSADGGRRREMGLGNYPEVTSAGAREKARAARGLIRQGVDPIEQQRTAQSAMRAAVMAALTFRQTAEAYMQAHESTWKNAKHGQQWRNTLEQHAFPVLGDLLVRDVNKEHVLQVLRPIWLTTNETAVRLRGRIELVLSYAMQAGFRPEGLNPARWKDGLDTLLARPSKVNNREHHAALPIDAMRAFMVKLRDGGGMGARALELVILNAARSGEVRGATWAEVDTDAKVWTGVPQHVSRLGE